MNDKSRLIEALTDTHRTIRTLVTSLSDEQLSVPYHPGVNPPLWEIGHTAYFFEYFILRRFEGAPSWNPAMDDIWDSFNIDHRDRWIPGLVPDRASTLQYVDTMHEAMLARIEVTPLSPEAFYLYRYAVFHQAMHIESMLWCRQTLAYDLAGYKDAGDAGAVSEPPLRSAVRTATPHDVAVPAGIYLIGMPQHDTHDSAYFAFDNEKPGFEIELQAFFISEYLVSNQEYIAFIDDLGYERSDLWSWGGKKWLRTGHLNAVPPRTDAAAAKHPIYWRRQDGLWLERHFSEWLPLELDHPVTHVTYWEAEAFCNWAGRRLPSEYEWEAAALGNKKGLAFKRFPWGDSMDDELVDMDGKRFARVPVSAYAEGRSPFGCRQMLGTVWEWTSSQFLPYDGFSVDMYPYMSTLQFGDHKTTKGGSCATSSRLVRGTYRQAYAPDRSDVFVGFRTCAR